MSDTLTKARALVSKQVAINARVAALEAAARTASAIAQDPDRLVQGTYVGYVLAAAVIYEEYILSGHVS
jgi:hypothetical protein